MTANSLAIYARPPRLALAWAPAASESVTAAESVRPA